MKLATFFALALSSACISLAHAATNAADAIGYIKTLSGSVTLNNGEAAAPAAIGSPVTARSILKTSADSSVGITLRDDTLLALGPNTEFAMRDYAYAPGEGKLSLVGRLTRGTLNYVSGVIAKLKPDAVSVETPSGLLGVRGTQFVVKVDDSEVAK